MNGKKYFRILLIFGFIISLILFVKMTYDLFETREWVAGWELIVPIFLFLIVIQAYLVIMVFFEYYKKSLEGKSHVDKFQEYILILGIPIVYISSFYACSAELIGCCDECTIMRFTLVPIIIIFAILVLYWRKMLYLLLPSIFLSLYPHCICANPANIWWINTIGGSPNCFLFAFTASLMAITGISGVKSKICIIIEYMLVIGVLLFAIGHTFFHFPW